MSGLLRRIDQQVKNLARRAQPVPTRQGTEFAARVEVNVSDELVRKLPKELRETVLADAAKAAGQIVLDEYRSNIEPHRDTGFLIDHLGARTKQYEKSQTMFHIVGPESKAFYAYFLEYGTENNQPPRPYFRRAIDTTMGRQTLAFTNTVRKGAMGV